MESIKDTKKDIQLTQEDFGTLAICAVRYCHGRRTYMPDLIRSIVSKYIKNISDKDLQVMLKDCEYQKNMELYGDEAIDKPGWIQWKQMLEDEKKSRE